MIYASQAYWDFVSKYGSRTMKNYLPDDDKCDHCFRYGRRCDSTQNGMPCLMCKNGKFPCRAQTKETKRLVLPKNRGRSKPITGAKQDPPSRRCFQVGNNCHLAGSAGSQCEHCKRHNIRCNWNLDGAKKSRALQKRQETRTQAWQERLGFTPVPRDQKCYRCAEKIIHTCTPHTQLSWNPLQLPHKESSRIVERCSSEDLDGAVQSEDVYRQLFAVVRDNIGGNKLRISVRSYSVSVL
jgi:hypothetical protein